MPATSIPRLGGVTNQPYVLAQSAVPVCLVSSGTMGNNGALSGITALPTTYSGGIWLRLPANAIQAGSAAGLYWTIMSSTTAGTVYNVYADPASPFTPYIPAANTPFVSTGPGAFTQTTASDITLVNVTVPGGAMGLNGVLSVSPVTSIPNNANNKIFKSLIASSAFVSATLTTSVSNERPARLRNRGTASSQVAYGSGSTLGYGPTTAAPAFLSVNTAVDQQLTFTAQLAVATDFLVLEGFDSQVVPS